MKKLIELDQSNHHIQAGHLQYLNEFGNAGGPKSFQQFPPCQRVTI